MPTKSQLLQAYATKNNGQYVHYSQSEEPTRTLIKTLPFTEHGICKALAAKWIVEHANGGSLWNWIFNPGTTNVRQSAIANLMINFIDSTKRTGPLANPTTQGKDTQGEDYQNFVVMNYLALYGLKRRGLAQEAYMGSPTNTINYGKGPKTGLALAQTLQPKYLNTTANAGTYVLIGLRRPGGGHAVCAFVGTDVCFFDANFGEFWFPTNDDFFAFFTGTSKGTGFWEQSGYSNRYESYYLLGYAKKVG